MEELLGRQPPHSAPAEQAVIGAMLIDPSCIPDVIEKVKSDEFYIQANRDIFDTIFAMFSYGQSVDAVTVLEQMKVRGVYKDTTQQYLMEVMQVTPTAANVLKYAAIVRDQALLRNLHTAADEINTMIFEGSGGADAMLEAAERKIYALRQGRNVGGLQPISMVIQRVYANLSEAASSGGGIPGVELHHHRQGDRGLPACTGSIRAVQGVAVQRAAVKRGLVHPGAEVGGSNAPAGGFQRDGLRGRRRQKCCRVQHAAQRLDGGAERLVHCNFLHRPAALPFCYGSDRDTGRGILFSKRQVKKKRRRLDRKIKTPPQNIPTKPAAAVCSLLRRWQPLAMRRPCSGSTQPKSTCEDGRSSFFQIAAFLLREGGGVSPATLECPPLRVQHCGAVSCSL